MTGESIEKVDISNCIKEDRPSTYADKAGALYAELSLSEEKKRKGQFFTPLSIARFMASMARERTGVISILDPGCGTCILSSCLIEELINKGPGIERVILVCYETDASIIPYAESVLQNLKQWCFGKDVNFEYSIHKDDFVIANKVALATYTSLFNDENEATFDIIISNPPYFKLAKNDERTLAAKSVVNGHANIYAIFMAVSAQLLNQGGELIFITPRSFSSGSYFQAFRTNFFNKVNIEQAHLFHSRKDTFSKDKVLQETMILKCFPKENNAHNDEITVTSSNGIKDLEAPETITLPADLVIKYDSLDKMVYLPISEKEKAIVELFRSWKGTLNTYNIQISTGPVVAHRAWDHIKEVEPSEEAFDPAPLFWLHNVSKMKLTWPLTRPNKGQYILIQERSLPILIPNKNYLLLRRFSSKDDKSRLIATPYFSRSSNATHIGVENKLNYIYRPNGELEECEIFGLAGLLNSTIFDQFFRILNGNVNVSATELRLMPLPPHETIKEIGRQLMQIEIFSVEIINQVVNERFQLETISSKYGQTRRSTRDIKDIRFTSCSAE